MIGVSTNSAVLVAEAWHDQQDANGAKYETGSED